MFFLKRAENKRFIDLEDTSYIYCDEIKKEALSLSSYYIVYYEKTWYEYNFGAQLINTEVLKEYKIGIKRLKSEKVDVNIFSEFIKGHNDKDLLIYLYTKASTYKDFFKSLKTHINDRIKLCLCLRGFLDEFVKTYLGIRIGFNLWRIDLQKLNVENYISLNNITQINIKPNFIQYGSGQSLNYKEIGQELSLNDIF